MSNTESVTQWITILRDGQQDGQQDAASNLWDRYVERLIRFANQRLANSSRRMADEEDVVICAFSAFFRGVEAGRFHNLRDRDDLWKILVMLTERRAIDQVRREIGEKRGGGKVLGDSALNGEGRNGNRIHKFLDSQPTPEFAAQSRDQLRVLLAALADGQLQRIAIAKMEGFTNSEIADQFSMSLSSVERKLRLVREIWNEGDF